MLLDRDKEGNELKLNGGIVTLELASETRVRKIGIFEDGMYWKKEYPKDFFRNFGEPAIGFCVKAIEILQPKTIAVVIEGKWYKMTYENFKRKLKGYKNFKKQGYELRMYILLSQFNDEE